MSSFYLGDRLNKYGTPISAFKCQFCGGEFTICPAIGGDKGNEFVNDGCGDAECDSYDPARDANVLFGDYTMFNRYCARLGIPPESVSHQLMSRTGVRKK